MYFTVALSIIELNFFSHSPPAKETLVLKKSSLAKGRKTFTSAPRSSIASIILTKEHKIVTEGMFDNLLRSIPFATESYLISLGRSMGAEEKLFGYKGNHYRTISIQYLKGE